MSSSFSHSIRARNVDRTRRFAGSVLAASVAVAIGASAAWTWRVLERTGGDAASGTTARGGAALWDGLVPSRPSLDALPADPLLDSDGDLLPDRLERVLLTDPFDVDTDRDGIDDFLATAQFRRLFDPPGIPLPMDDEMRVVVSTTADGRGNSSVWMHFLFRFVGANLSELRGILPYIDRWGVRVPIGNLLGAGLVGIRVAADPIEGLYCVASFQLADEAGLRALMPCTIGATALVGSRLIHSGAYLQEICGLSTVVMPADDDFGFVMPLSPDEFQDPFWSSARVCVLQLALMSQSPEGAMCEVRNAECMSNGRLSCPPTCLSSRGRTMFFPNGMRTITGGGR